MSQNPNRRYLAASVPTGVKIRRHSTPVFTREASLPELDDGHSGNAFGGACALAFALLTGQRV